MDVTPELKQQLASRFWRGWTWRGRCMGWDDMTAEEQQQALREYARRDWNEDDHPRAPAGGPDGGQFTSGDGGGGGAGGGESSAPSAGGVGTASPRGSSGTVHSGGHVTPEMFERPSGPQEYTRFESLNHAANAAINSAEPGIGGASGLKNAIVSDISNRLQDDSRWTKAFGKYAQTTSYERANQIVHAWAMSSGDHDALSVAMQLATRDEFELSGTATKHMVSGWGNKESKVWEDAAKELGGLSVSNAKGALRAFSRAEYNKTQEWLASKGITEVAVYRGMGRALGRQNYVAGATTLQPMSSFSTSLQTARGFVPYGPKYKQNVLASVVPAKSVISTCRSGRGCWSESEVVVLGNKMGFIGFQKDSKWPPPAGKIKWPKGKAWDMKVGGTDEVNLDDLNIDADLDNADWTKQAWDLPPYKSPEFNALVPDLTHFRTLPVYRHAVQAGLIVNDEWIGAKAGQRRSAAFLTRSFARARGAVYLDDKEFNEDEHPRAPAGGPDGGQFTSGGGGGGGSSEAKPSGGAAAGGAVATPGGYVTPEMFDHNPGEQTKFQQENRKLDAAIGNATHSPDDFDNPETREIIGRLSERLNNDPAWSKVVEKAQTESQVEGILAQWASTSGDTDAFAVAMQLATREEFNLKGAATKHMLEKFPGREGEVWEKAGWHMGAGPNTTPEDLKGALRAFSRAEYNQTQEWLASKGIKEVAVYRGMDRALGRQKYAVGTTTLQPMSSFSSSLYRARDFAETAKLDYRMTVLASMVPASSVLSVCRTGRGTWEESEVVVLGNKMTFLGFHAEADFPPPKGKVKWPGGKAVGDSLDDLRVDEDLLNADWTKQTWDLPPYKSDAFNALGFDLNNFRKLPVYQHAVAKGLIKNDEWVGPSKAKGFKYSEDQPRDDSGRWTSGGGGGGSKPAADKPKPQAARYESSSQFAKDRFNIKAEEVEGIVRDELKKHNMEDIKAKVSSAYGRYIPGVPGGERGGVASAYYLASIKEGRAGSLMFYSKMLGGQREDYLRGTISHEATHVRWDNATTDKGFQKFLASAENIDALRREDGSTPYSRDWWAKSNRESGNLETLHNAVNESLAEFNKWKTEEGEAKAFAKAPTYFKLNGLVDSIWSNGTGKFHGRSGKAAEDVLLHSTGGDTIAYFTKELELTDKDSPDAEIVHVIRGDGSSLWGVRKEDVGPEYRPPKKGAVYLNTKYSEDQPRNEDGEWTDGGGSSRSKPDKPAGKPSGGKQPSSAKVARALSTHKPSTKEKQDRATAAEKKVTKMIGGKGTDNNSPMDVTLQVGRKTIGVEVKSVQDNGNNKITMHPASLQRKRDWEAGGKGRSVHTVVVDTRFNKIYYRKGAGSFRLHTLTVVKSATHLRQLMGI